MKSFTLLELLVVIIIIGILASIVVVSMSGSTNSAEIAKGKAYSQQVHALLGYQVVLDLNFNEGDYGTCPDGTDVCDASGYNNNGEIYNDNATYISSPIDGYSLSFNGTSDYIDCGNDASLDINNEITLETWVKYNVAPNSFNGVVVGKGTLGSSDYSGYYIYSRGLAGNEIQFAYGHGTANTSATFSMSAYGIVQGQWYHLVGTFDKDGGINNIKIYLNGVNVGNGTNSFAIKNTSLNLRIGQDSTHFPFSGLIDEVRIYSVALPSTEIQKHYVQDLERLLADNTIPEEEYVRRISEFNRSLSSI
jgi:prepilin-type N-terminal cleavage/methylation domain-containing protein